MQKIDAENKSLRLENAQLRSELAKLKKELEATRLHLEIVQNSREKIEEELAGLVVELRELRQSPTELVESPILDEKIQEEEQETSIENEKHVHFVEKVKQFDDEPEVHEFSGSTNNLDYISTWKESVCIQRSEKNSVTIKNTHHVKPVCLDDYILARLVDGKDTVPPTPLPFGIVIAPGDEYTIHSNHREAREVPGKSCVMHRFETFGSGKVSETQLLNENGRETAKYTLTCFR